MANTNNPYNYKPEFTGIWEGCRNVQNNRDCDLGLAGIAVTTRDSFATLRIFFRGADYPRYDFNRVKVFHNFSPHYEIRLHSGGLAQQRTDNGRLGYTQFKLGGYLDTLDLEFIQRDSAPGAFTLFGLSLENDDPGFNYHAIGVNGASVPSYLRCKLFASHLDAINPDLVILSIGINDAYTSKFSPAQFEKNYDSLIAAIRRAAPGCSILFTTNNDSYYKRRYPNRNAELVRKVMLKLALRHNCAVWDMYGVMGGLGSVRTWQRYGLARPDKIHLTKEGYQLVGDLLFKALMEAYDYYLAHTENP